MTDDISEIETRPHVFIDDCDHSILELLTAMAENAKALRPIDQLAFAAVSYMGQQVHVLKGELKRHQNMIQALSDGSQARSLGKPITACPYVPDEPDCLWMFWRQGWESG